MQMIFGDGSVIAAVQIGSGLARVDVGDSQHRLFVDKWPRSISI